MLSVLIRKALSVALSFLVVFAGMPPFAFAQTIPLMNPEISMRVHPVLMRGMKLNSDDGLRLSFIMDSGDMNIAGRDLHKESIKLIEYFLAALTIPEGDVWVNLSPYEKDRITSAALGQTGMGRDLLGQDYLLKRMTASLLDPEGETGKKFWDKVYVSQGFDVPAGAAHQAIESFNKIWIMPDQAQVFAQGDAVVVIDAKLKVMMEEDYLAREQSAGADGVRPVNEGASLAPLQDDIQSAMRSTIIPIIEEEVNNGEAFAPLRQIYHALILAKWFKQNLKESFLARSYADQSKVKGIDTNDPRELDRIYNQYLDVFQKSSAGQFRDDYDPATQQIVTRKYITGGFVEGKFDIGNQADLNVGRPAFYPLGQMAQMDVILKNAAMMNSVPAIRKEFILILSLMGLLFFSSQAAAQGSSTIVQDSLIVDDKKEPLVEMDSVELRLKLQDALMNNYDVYQEHLHNNRRRIFYTQDSWDAFMEKQWSYFRAKKLPPGAFGPDDIALLLKNYRLAQSQRINDSQAHDNISRTAKPLPFEFNQMGRMSNESHALARVYLRLLMDGSLPYQTLADIIAAQRGGSKVQQSAAAYVEAWLMYTLKDSEKQRKRYTELFPTRGKSLSNPNFDAALSDGGKLSEWSAQYIRDLAHEAAEAAYEDLVITRTLAQRDKAMMSEDARNGGIDFDWQAAGFQVSGSGVDYAMMIGGAVDIADVQGLVPVIIGFIPITGVVDIFQ